ALAGEAGYAVGNVDVTIVCEAPKIEPHREAMRARLAELLGTRIDAVNVKGTTSERLGFTGRGEGIAAQASALLVPLERTCPDALTPIASRGAWSGDAGGSADRSPGTAGAPLPDRTGSQRDRHLQRPEPDPGRTPALQRRALHHPADPRVD